MKKLFVYFILLMLVSLVTITGEQVFLKVMDSKVTKLKDSNDIVKNENIELKDKISKVLAIEKLNNIAESNNFLKPTETDIIHLKND